jgi:EAL domain-containing protein (putative c-di-GMP-specific phosphodiesterase class I)
MGCPVVQGFFHGRPVPAADVPLPDAAAPAASAAIESNAA